MEVDRARNAAAEAAIRAIEEALHGMASGQSDENAIRIRRSDDIERHLRLAGLRAERDALFALARTHSMSDKYCRKLVREIDLQEERLR